MAWTYFRTIRLNERLGFELLHPVKYPKYCSKYESVKDSYTVKVFYKAPKIYNQKSKENESALKTNYSLTITFVEYNT